MGPIARRSRLLAVAAAVLGSACISFGGGPSLAASKDGCAGRDGLLPGCETNHLSDMEPSFRGDVAEVLRALKQRGFDPRVAATYRSPDRQEFLFEVGQVFEAFGSSPFTRARAHQSCHNAQDASGGPASLAVDIVPGPALRTAGEKARFFKALGEAARGRKLIWGGSWARKNRTWKQHGLGWDPAHLQSRRCRW